MTVVTERWDICYYADLANLIFGTILCSVSLLTLTAISMDRLLALFWGLRYRHIVTMRKANVSVIVMWILSAFIGAANYSFYSLIFNWSTFITISLCVVISSLCYAKIFFTLRGRQFHVQDGAFQRNRNQKALLNIARYRKAVHNALWVQVTLLVCYLPFCIAMVLRPESPAKSEITFSVYYLAENSTFSLLLANSSLNPFLYCWRIREVRKAVKETISHFFCSSN